MTSGRVTILVPSHRRPQLLGRALAYYAPSGLPAIVADSSPEPFAGAAQFPWARYLHLPGVPFEAKLQQLAGMVETPYAVLCADDDFTTVTSMLRCADFLDAHPDHCGAHGHYLRVVRRPRAAAVVEPCYRDTHRAGVRAEDPAERLLELNRPYVPLFYAVLRADVLREAFGPGHETEHFYASSELALGLAAAMLGKVAVLPCLHTVRDIVPSVDLAGPKVDSLGVVSTAPQYREVYGSFVERLAGIMSRRCGLGLDAARAAVLASVAGFVAGYCQRGRRTPFVCKLPRYGRRALHVLAPPLARREEARAQALREAEVREYLAPAGAEAWKDLDAILLRMAAGQES